MAFNLGIEAMQMIVVAAILPSLLLMSRMRIYTVFRIAGASFAGVASLAWIMERLFDVTTPIDTIVNTIARQTPWIAAALFVAGLAVRILFDSRR